MKLHISLRSLSFCLCMQADLFIIIYVKATSWLMRNKDDADTVFFTGKDDDYIFTDMFTAPNQIHLNLFHCDQMKFSYHLHFKTFKQISHFHLLLHLCVFSKRAATTFSTPRPGMTSVACVVGTTHRVKPWRGPSTMHSTVSPAAPITRTVR